MTDTQLGYLVFEKLNYYMKRFYSKSYTVEQYAAAMRFSTSALLDGVGFAYRIGLDLNPSKLDQSMKLLAEKSEGRIPSKATMDAAMREAAASYTFSEAAGAVIKGTAEEIGKGLQDIGNFTISALKWLPWIAGGGVVAYFGLKLYLESRKK